MAFPETVTPHNHEPFSSTDHYLDFHRQMLAQRINHTPNQKKVLQLAKQMLDDDKFSPEPEQLQPLGVEDPLALHFQLQFQEYLHTHPTPEPQSDQERFLIVGLEGVRARGEGTYGIGATWRHRAKTGRGKGVEYIALGRNGLFNYADPTAHAEMMALRISAYIKQAFMTHPEVQITSAQEARIFLARTIPQQYRHDLIVRDVATQKSWTEMDTNLEPCSMCTTAIINEAAPHGLRGVQIASADSPFAPLGSQGADTLPPEFARILQLKIANGTLIPRFVRDEGWENTDADPQLLDLCDQVFLKGRGHLDRLLEAYGTSAKGYLAIEAAHI